MLEFYWGCLIAGILFAVISVIFGDILGCFLDGIFDFLLLDGPDYIHPMVIMGGVTVLGGTGIVFTEYTSLPLWLNIILSILIAGICSILVYLGYVKPMQRTENSTGYSIQELTGKLAEVIVPIPAQGFGEVMVKVGAANTNQIAASFDKEEIQSGSKVVVVEVKDHVLFVCRFENT
jgi:membrane protein implicated in regulation of membrane protease activity